MNQSNMYAEVYEILTLLGSEYIDKIPSNLYKYIENKRNKNYLTNINTSVPIEQQNIMNETIEFISLINIKYWTNEEERKTLISIYNTNEKNYNEECRKKYDPNNIFKNNVNGDGSC